MCKIPHVRQLHAIKHVLYYAVAHPKDLWRAIKTF